MHLILCHVTADFDTLGAAVGLSRLHPGARIVLTGGAHPTVQQFLALHRDEYPLIERRSVNPEQIRSISIVDAQRRDRLGKAAEWLDHPDVEITIYDHHTASESDIAATARYLAPIGATTTLIVEQLQAQQILPTPAEATVMALGIHADTGSLTFTQTTARDARALAWLLEQDAAVRTIADFVHPGLSPELQALLKTALEQLQRDTVHGYLIAWVKLELTHFTPGLSGLASHLITAIDADALLLAAQINLPEIATETATETELTVIGRSTIDGTNLAHLLQPWGGGGHASAASVNLRCRNPLALLHQLVAELMAQIPQPPTARELMSSPVRTVRPETTIAEAQRVLLRYGHSGLSVMDAEGQLVGILSRRDLDIALHHGFSHAPVKGYMSSNLKTITPETQLPEIESLMVTYDIGRLPVLDRGQLVGIVTRTDVLRQLHRQSQRSTSATQTESLSADERSTPRLTPRPPTNLVASLQKSLLPELWQVLTEAAAQAEQRGWHLYLVGGGVRDLLRSLMQLQGQFSSPLLLEDIDLVVDGFHRAADVGAGVELARALQMQYPEARLEVHGKFQTAAVLWHNHPTLKSLWVDIATARTEFYPYPAANPEVEASSIQQDLYRRDFTINALAIRLTQPRSGELLDFFGGLLDLRSHQIRVLHANSFIEDPTRIYRAVRFAVRLDFGLEPQTEGYIHHAIASGIYDQIQREQTVVPALQTRLRAELKYLLQAPYWQRGLRMLGALDALRCIHPTLKLEREGWRQLRLLECWLRRSRAVTDSNWHQPPDWLLRLEVLLAQLAPDDRAPVATNLQLPSDSLNRLSQLATAEAAIQAALPTCEQPSQVLHHLRPYEPALLGLVALRSDRASRRLIWQYLTHWSLIKPLLNGADLKRLGYKPGKEFKQMLEAIAAATLDGTLQTQSDAEAFLRQHFPLG